jgi:dolichyl-phosphate-mannose-protein mannosyltransferase
VGSSRWRRWRSLTAPLAAGLLARLALIAWTTPLALSLDEARFVDLATTGMRETAFLPPLWPLVLACIRAFVGDSLPSVRAVIACLSIGSIAFVYVLAERHMGRGSGPVAAWIAALLPTLVYFDGRLRSEWLVILLLLGFACLWTGAPTRAGALLGAGCVLGLVVLARPEFALIPIFLVALGVARGEGNRAFRKGALLAPGCLLLVLPWVVRNEVVVGAGPVISTNGGYNFWKSFNAQTDGSQIPVTDLTIWDGVPESRMDEVGYSEGWRYIAGHPVRSLLLAPAKWGHLFGPERDYLSDLRQEHLPRLSRALDLLFGLLQNAAWFLIMGAGLFALLGPRRSEVKDCVLAALGTLLLVHLIAFGDDRFHVPLLPFLCVALPEAWDGSLRPRRAVRLLVVLLAVEALFWALVVARDAGRIAMLLRG